MKFLCSPNGLPIITVDEKTDKIIVNNPFFDQLFRNEGIALPAFIQPNFNNIYIIKLGKVDNKTFLKALNEYYIPYVLNKSGQKYEWKEV